MMGTTEEGNYSYHLPWFHHNTHINWNRVHYHFKLTKKILCNWKRLSCIITRANWYAQSCSSIFRGNFISIISILNFNSHFYSVSSSLLFEALEWCMHDDFVCPWPCQYHIYPFFEGFCAFVSKPSWELTSNLAGVFNMGIPRHDLLLVTVPWIPVVSWSQMVNRFPYIFLQPIREIDLKLDRCIHHNLWSCSAESPPVSCFWLVEEFTHISGQTVHRHDTELGWGFHNTTLRAWLFFVCTPWIAVAPWSLVGLAVFAYFGRSRPGDWPHTWWADSSWNWLSGDD